MLGVFGDFEVARNVGGAFVVLALVAYYLADRRWGRPDRWDRKA